MADYCVRWLIDIEADTPRAAVLEAAEIMAEAIREGSPQTFGVAPWDDRAADGVGAFVTVDLALEGDGGPFDTERGKHECGES